MNRNHIILLGIAIMPFFAYASNKQDQSISTLKANTFCPVMGDMKVDTQVYTDYDGKRVYFCCAKCRSIFKENPGKYLQRLRQFGAANRPVDNAGENRGRHFSFVRLIEPLGITTIILLMFTGVTGIFRRKLPRELVRWHKRFGVITIGFAILHGLLVLFIY